MVRLSLFGLRTQLLLLVIVALVPALILTLYNGQEQRRIIKQQADEHQLELVKLAATSATGLVPEDGQFLKKLATQLPVGSDLLIVDSRGLVVAAYPDGSKVTGRSEAQAPLVKAIVTQRQAVSNVPGLNGVVRLYAFAPLRTQPGSETYLSIGIPPPDVFAAVDQARENTLSALELVIVLALVAAWVGGDFFILRRVRALVRASRRLGAGDLSVRTGLAQRGEELGELAGAFDDMAAALERDAAKRKRAEQRLAVQYASASVLAASSTLAEATPQILRTVCESLVWDWGALWKIDQNANVLRCVDVWHADSLDVDEFKEQSKQLVLAPGIGLPGRVWQSGEPTWIPDLVVDPNFPRSRSGAEVGLHGAFGFPIRSGNAVLGVIEFMNHAIREPDDDLLRAMTAVGSQIGLFMERTQAEEASHASEARTRLIVDTALDAVITMDAAGQITGWNPRAEAIFGWTRHEAIGRRMSETIVPERYREAHDRGLQQFLVTGEGPGLNQRIEISAMRHDGEEFPVELSITPLQNGGATSFCEFVRDITERKQAEEALRAAKDNLERRVDERTRDLNAAVDQLEIASRHKSEFLANMSHELRTPLNAIIGFSEVLLEKMFGDLNDKQDGYIQDILESGKHLLSLINDILDLSKIEAGRMELELTAFSLPDTLRNGLTMIKERASRHGIELGLEIDPELGFVEADERKIKQILFNLLSNAVKFTPDGGRVEVTAHSGDGEIMIAVRDTGIGIALEDQERIFEEFQQAGGTPSTQRHEGTGLGLALAKRFVELHGGRLWVESGLGAGSTFAFTVPAANPMTSRDSPSNVERFGHPDGASQPVPSNVPSVRTSAPTILLVEDDPRSVDLFTLHLSTAGFQVVVAGDGAAGLELARLLRPAVITLDIMLPGLDGWDFLNEIKADPVTADLPVIIVSILDDRGKGFALGAAEYLVKPVSRDELIAVIRRFTADRRAPGDPVKILAIDDDPMATALVEAILKPEGFVVMTATGGGEGIALVHAERPDVVILDLLMPDMDGFAVVEQLQADANTAKIPIVILTSKEMTRVEKDRLTGHVSYLAKKGEFDRDEFIALVRSLLDREYI